MSDPRTPQELRSVAHRAVTEGVNIRYVQVMRSALYAAADENERLLEALRRIAEHYEPNTATACSEIAREALREEE